MTEVQPASGGAVMDFWFDFASTYSYLSVMRMDERAAAVGVTVRWRPFLLGPIMQAFGWETSPFNIFPAKGAHMWRDMERRSEKYGLAFRRPDVEAGETFPQSSLLAARVALVLLDGRHGAPFTRAVFEAQFQRGENIADADVLARSAAAVGIDESAWAEVMERALLPENKARLRASVSEAEGKGIFGAPSFTVGGELFWGDDRLDDALMWARASRADG